MIIIGSEAIKYYFQNFKRVPKDIDVVLDEGEELNLEGNYSKVEILPNPVLLKYFKDNKIVSKYCPPNILYTLKMSHIFWDINWDKHLSDILFLRGQNCVLIKDLFYDLYNYWNEFHSKNKRSDLKMSAEDFFDNAIKYPVEHDTLHEMLIKHPYFESSAPTYTKILKDGCEVEVCEEKFNELSHFAKCNLVMEEVMVMALERYSKTEKWFPAYCKMLKKFIISHAPIWEAIFILENFNYVYKPKFNFYQFLQP